jgi:hypothetical protein
MGLGKSAICSLLRVSFSYPEDRTQLVAIAYESGLVKARPTAR